MVNFFLLSSCIANFNEHMIVIFYRSLYKDSICWYHQLIIISTCITYNMTYLAPFDPCLTRLKFKSTAGPPVTVTSCVCGWKLLNRKKNYNIFKPIAWRTWKLKYVVRIINPILNIKNKMVQNSLLYFNSCFLKRNQSQYAQLSLI